MPEFLHDGINFNYEIRGEGKPLFLLHGVGGSLNQPKNLFDDVPGVQMIFLDQRSHGKTPMGDPEKLDFSVYADDVIALADHLGFDKFSVGGISVGAAVSTNLAIRYPERIKSILLYRIAYADAPMLEEHILWNKWLGEYLQKGSKEEFINSDFYKYLKTVHLDTSNIYLSAFDDEASLKYPEKYFELPKKAPFEDIELLRSIECPALICSDKFCPIHRYELGQLYNGYLKYPVFYPVAPKSLDFAAYRKDCNEALRAFKENI